jgi:hypothetical protein
VAPGRRFTSARCLANVRSFLNTDQNSKHQQNLADRQIAIVVLPTTGWPVIQKPTSKIAAVLDSVAPGDFTQIDLHF